MTPLQAQLALLGARLRVELRRLGRWSEAPLHPDRLVDMGAFGQRTLAAEEWLQHVLVARLDAMGAGAAPPASSEVAVWATREFDGDRDAAGLLAILGDLDARCAPAADPTAPDASGVPPLHRAASGGADAALAALVHDGRLDPALVPEPHGDLGPVAAALLAGAADAPLGPWGLTPWMVARAFGRRDVVAVLRAAGADPGLRDALGRDAEAFGAFAVAARLARTLPRSPGVRAAWFARLHLPVTHQLTTPIVALELTGPLAPDTFADWPADEPITVMAMGDDAVSRLLRLGPPIYRYDEPVDCVAMAEGLAAELSASRGESWTARPSGTTPPAEAWVHGPAAAPGRVGCFPGRVVVWVDGAFHEAPVATRSALRAVLPWVAARVEEQLAAQRHATRIGARIGALTQELAARLGERVPAPGRGGWQVDLGDDRGVVFYRSKGRSHPVLTLSRDGDRVRVRAGAWGPEGHEADLDRVDAHLDAIAAAVARSLTLLTIDRLEDGAAYRVRAPFAGLAAGEVVTFLGADELDNHYGLYRFRRADGSEAQVPFDPAQGTDRRGDPLRETHRWLEPAGP